ncbi:ABC transporter permease, partial [Candidatus Woesearchaeota archaeon]|nr:ABC transporter permease [Candidatus Woesearchaeota archaeon]
MWSLWNIIQKNIKLITRSKASALIILLGPLLLILLIGMAFSGSTLYNINVGVYSPSYSELTNSIITALEDNQFFVTKLDSEEQCIQDTKYGKYHICAVFPPDMAIEKAAEGNTTNAITFHVDYSRINLVYAILDTIAKKVAVKSSELSGELVQVLLDTLENSRINLIDKKGSITELSASNKETKSGADAILDELNSLSIDFNVTDIQDRLTELENRTNDSAVLNVISDLEEEIEAIDDEISASVNAKNTISEKGIAIKDAMTNDARKLTALKAALEDNIKQIEAIKITEKETILSPIRTQIQPLTERKSHWNNLFPTLVILMVSFVSLLLSTTLVVREKSAKAYF